MGTFGEIVEPITRTAWEDWDDEDNFISKNVIPQLEFQNKEGPVEDIGTFVITEGKYLEHYLKIQGDCNLEHVHSVSEFNLDLFKMKTSDQYICIIKNYNLVESSDIVALLRKYLVTSKNVITLQTKPLAEYQTPVSQDLSCIIRIISTSDSTEFTISNLPRLEQPNIISGVSAGVITLREHLDLPATAVICYIEYPSEYNIEEIEALLDRLNILPNVKTLHNNLMHSNLYI